MSQLLKQTGHTHTRTHTIECNRTQCKNQFHAHAIRLCKAHTLQYSRRRGGQGGRQWPRYCTGVNVNNKASSKRALRETKRTVALYKNALKTTRFSKTPSISEARQLLSTLEVLLPCDAQQVTRSSRGVATRTRSEPPAWRRDNHPQAEGSDARGLVTSSPRHWPRRTQGSQRAASDTSLQPVPLPAIQGQSLQTSKAFITL